MSTSEVAVADQPTAQQLLFARAVILTFQLWPAMRLAVSEEWGGPDSAEKRDFLISHICDEHGQAGASFEPDLDDLADMLEGYIVDEFECRLEDGSPDWVAGRLVGLHHAVFGDDQGKAAQAVQELQNAADQLKGRKANVERGPEDSSSEDEEMDEDDHDHHHDPAMAAARHLTDSHGGVTSADSLGATVGLEQQQRRQQEQVSQPPIIDEDGFETVVSRRRKK